jgi:D-xylose reductase
VPDLDLRYVPLDVRYPPEWVDDPDGPNPVMVFAPVPIAETWAGPSTMLHVQTSWCIRGCAPNPFMVLDPVLSLGRGQGLTSAYFKLAL